MDGRFGDLHVAGFSRHEEIDIVGRAVGRFHVDAGKIFAFAQTGEPVVMHSDQIEGEVLALVIHVKLLVARVFALATDVLLDPGRNLRRADFFPFAFLRMLAALLGVLTLFGFLFFLWMLWMFLSKVGHRGSEEQRYCCCDDESCNHRMGLDVWSLTGCSTLERVLLFPLDNAEALIKPRNR